MINKGVHPSKGRWNTRNGGIVDVVERCKPSECPSPLYPWHGVIPGVEDDGWDDQGRSWLSPKYDLSSRIGPLS